MNKERFKNLLLVFLIAMNFILGSRILIEKKLWPSGYNFFSDITSFDIGKIFQSLKSEENYKSRLLSPEKIIINTGDQTTRLSLSPSDEDFNEILEEAYIVMQKAFSDSETPVISITKEEFYSALGSSSLYMEYSASYKPDLFARLIGTSSNITLSLPDGFSQAIVSYSPKTSVYLTNSKNDLFYKINVNKSSENLVIKLGECVEKRQNNTSVINYSFDLKFDQPFGSQKTTISPFVQIYSTPKEYPVIIAKNPLIDDDGNVDEETVNAILEVFSINPNTMNRYTEAGGTIVFVENNATLKLDKNGYLEYTAISPMLAQEEANDEYSLISQISSLADGVNRAINNENAMCLTNVFSAPSGNVSLDYMANGLRVKLESNSLSSAVEATVSNNQLISYKQLMRSYETTNTISVSMQFLEALDAAIGEYSKSMNEINIDKMYAGYIDDTKNGEKTAEWIVNVDNVIIGE